MAELARSVGRYEIVRQIGRGGMAVVYLARQHELDRLVALKELRTVQPADSSPLRRFVRESRVAGALSHPNIVTVYDYFECEGTPYIAMEYVPSGSLRRYVGTLSLAQVAGVLEGVLAGLAHAEQHGIVHRDLKPENVMVTADGRVKIADFGVAKTTTGLGTGTSLTATGTTLGTPSYMAPEQAMGLEVGPWTDLYSLGCMAYEMVTGDLPFADTESPLAILLRHVHETPGSAASVNPAVDFRVSDWIDRLLRKDPCRRPRGAADAWRQLEEIVVAIEGRAWRRGAPLVGAPAKPASDPLESGEYESYVPLPPPRPPVDEPGVESPQPAASALATTVSPDHVSTPAVPAPLRSRLDTAAAIGLVALVVAAGPVALIARGGARPPEPLDAGALRVRPPAGWARLSPPPRLPGLELTDAIALAPDGGRRGAGAALVGFAPRSAHRRSLLATELTDAPVPAGDRVRLRSGLDALRYRRLRIHGRSVTVYAVPTSAGVATVACVAPAGDADCRRLADSLTLRRVRAFPLGPSRAFAGAVNRALDRLERVLDSRTAALGAAPSPLGQADAAAAIAGAYGRAGAALGELEVSPADEASRTELLRALSMARVGYRRLAAAARSADGVRYDAAAARAQAGQRRLERAIRALAGAGYRALVPARSLVRTVPAMKLQAVPAGERQGRRCGPHELPAAVADLSGCIS